MAKKYKVNDVDAIYVPEELPPQAGNAGKFLSTDGSAVFWGAVGGGGGTLGADYVSGGGNAGTNNDLGSPVLGMDVPVKMYGAPDNAHPVLRVDVANGGPASAYSVTVDAGSKAVVHATGGLDGGGWYNVRHYGAVGDGVADDSAAVQAALDACKADGGGTVFFPWGLFKIASAISLTTGLDCSSIVLAGPGGTGAQLVITTGAAVDAITLIIGTATSCSIEVRDLAFRAPAGNVPGVTQNCHKALVITDVQDTAIVTMRRCLWLGVWSASSLVEFGSGMASAEDVGFYGCSPQRDAANTESAYIAFLGCYQATARRVTGIDIVAQAGLSYDGTSTFGIYFTARAPAAPQLPSPLGVFVVEDCVFDEGFGLNNVHFGERKEFFPGSYKFAKAVARDIFSNCPGSAGTNTIRAEYGAGVTIERVNPSWATTGPKPCITLLGIDAIEVDDVNCKTASGPSVLEVDTAVYVPAFVPQSGSVRVRNSNFTSYTIPVDKVPTFVENNGLRTRLRYSQGAVEANTIVKPGATPQKVDQLGVADDARIAQGVVLDDAAGADIIVRVVEESGQQVEVKSDGAAVLAPTDTLTTSGASAGRVKKTTVAGTSTVGLSVGAATNVADTLVKMIWQRGQY